MVCILLSAQKAEIERRILSRDRIEEQKREEMENIDFEIEEANEILKNDHFWKRFDTTGLSSKEISIGIQKIT
ncbi:MAG: hypothetical protein JXD23_08015 [Spirochaetales bacterium]|nr:hypothetical protein [Spirochaetales bacterium]